MAIIKKKELKKYQFTELDDSNEESNEEVIDELVGSMGGSIGGDEIETTSQIKTAPQATTNDFAQKAIQPNRYLYNISATGGAGGSVRGADDAQISDSHNREAKGKMINLLESMSGVVNEPISDDNGNNINDIDDIKKLGPNVVNKVRSLVNVIDSKELSPEDTLLTLDYLFNKIKDRLENG